MEITYPVKEANIAELKIGGKLVQYKIPPAVGTHSQVFQELLNDDSLETAQGEQIAAYVHGCLHKKNEWADQNRVRFPSKNYLRIPAVLTIVPKNRKFGDLEGGMLVDTDLAGEGIEMQTEVPNDLTGWEESDGGILKKGSRLFVPHNSWYKNQWDKFNGVVIALVTHEGAESLDKIAQDTGRTYKPLWKVNPNEIKSPMKRVPVLGSDGAVRLILGCNDCGDGRYGSGVGVLK